MFLFSSFPSFVPRANGREQMDGEQMAGEQTAASKRLRANGWRATVLFRTDKHKLGILGAMCNININKEKIEGE